MYVFRDKVEEHLVDGKEHDGSIGKYKMKMEVKTTLRNSEMQQIYFRKNSKRKMAEQIRMKNKINKQDGINLMFV